MPGPDGRTRVLWLAKGLGQGGMERLLVTHARFGDRENFDYRAAYLVDRPHSVIDELVELDVPVERLGSGNGNDPRWVADLIKLVRSERIDVVHAHSPMAAAMARPALAVACPQVRFVYTEHNRWDRYSTLTRWANRLTFRFNDAAYAVSDDCRSTVPPSLRPQISTLIHGIDVDAVSAHRADRAAARAELGIDDGTVVVGTVANLRKQKNYPMLLEAAAKVCSERDDIVFLAVGQGPLEAELRARHAELGLGDRFRFLGFRPDVHRVMSAFDIFCLSSDHEGLPVSLMEAMALGLPVVSTAVGGIPEAVDEYPGAAMVAPRDAGELAVALTAASMAKTLGNAAARDGGRSRRFDASVAVDVIERVYGSARSRPARRPDPESTVRYAAIVATFRRPRELRGLLTSVMEQSVAPIAIVVADNDPDGSSAPIVAEHDDEAGIPVVHLQQPANGGPAGAWAAAAAHAGVFDVDWLLVLDDDDPLGDAGLVEALLSAPGGADGPDCAAVGLRGARLGATGRLRRVAGPRGLPVRCDYLASGGAALYRRAAVDQVGFFDPELFFGFEDLDEGLRLKAAGWTCSAIAFGDLHTVADTSGDPSEWREYFKARALTWVLRHRGTRTQLVGALTRSVVLGSVRIAVQRQSIGLARARLEGARDGLLGRMGSAGRAPLVNPAKAASQRETASVG